MQWCGLFLIEKFVTFFNEMNIKCDCYSIKSIHYLIVSYSIIYDTMLAS